MAAAPPPVQPGPPQGQQGYPQQGYPQQAPRQQQGYPQAQPGYDQQPQVASPAPIVQDPAARSGRWPSPRRCLRPEPESQRPGAPRALGGGQMPMSSEAAVGAPGGRGPGEPLNLGGPRDPGGALPPPAAAAPPPRGPGPGASAALTTLPPSATPKDEFDLGIGYMQRKDYALAEETMKNFAQKYPSDPLIADLAILARRKLFPAPAISRRCRSVPRRDHQVRQVGQGASTPCCGSASRWRR